MTKPIQLFGLGQQGKSPNVTAQRRVNLYAEIQFEQDKTRVAYYPTPGLVPFVDLGASPIRGMHTVSVSNFLYAAQFDQFYEINAAGGITPRGTFASNAGRVNMADDGTRILMVDGSAGYYYNVQTGVFSTIADADFPNGARTCCFLAGRMIVEDPSVPGQFRWSDLYADTWPALNFATAEANPDPLIAVYALNGNLLLMGETTIEFWGTTADAAQPYAWIGSATAQWGLAARQSIARLGQTCAFLGRNQQGQVQVVRIEGYQVVPISIPEVDYLLNQYAGVENATAYSYMLGGHPMYEISFPSAGKSWLYDMASQAWSELRSSSDGIHPGEIAVNYRNAMYVSDAGNGELYRLDPYVYTENGQAVQRQIVGRHIFQGDLMSITEMWIDIEMGVGTVSGAGDNPQLRLRTSKDGGHTWSNELWQPIGRQGVYQARAVFRRLGRARDWLFELSLTDPVKANFIGAFMEAA
jgi:hypothetical protein